MSHLDEPWEEHRKYQLLDTLKYRLLDTELNAKQHKTHQNTVFFVSTQIPHFISSVESEKRGKIARPEC